MKPIPLNYWQTLRAKSLTNNPLKRSPLVRKGKPIRKVSTKLAKMKTIYGHLRNEFMEANPYCQARLPECTIQATDLHHKNKRNGDRLIDQENFMAVCRSCHDMIHGKLSSEEARDKGLII